MPTQLERFYEAVRKVTGNVTIAELRADPDKEVALIHKLQTENKRPCGDCTLCCKVMGVQEIDKPAFRWCKHCDPRAGCKIYEDRPRQCRIFLCAWAMGMGSEEAKPSKSHCVIYFSGEVQAWRVHVDPGYPMAWQQGAIGEIILDMHAAGHDVIVVVGNDYIGLGAPMSKPRKVLDHTGVHWVTLEPVKMTPQYK